MRGAPAGGSVVFVTVLLNTLPQINPHSEKLIFLNFSLFAQIQH